MILKIFYLNNLRKLYKESIKFIIQVPAHA